MKGAQSSDSARNNRAQEPAVTAPAAESDVARPAPWTEQPWGDAFTFRCALCPYAHEDPAVIADHVRGVHGVTTTTRPGG